MHTGTSGPSVAVRLHDPVLPLKLVVNPWLNIGEAYMDGTLTVEEGTLGDMLKLCLENAALLKEAENPLFSVITDISMLRTKIKNILQRNGFVRARRNVAHHYDLSDQLYESFLDNDRQYSCAYFLNETDSLETAQENKKRHIAAKLLLKPGQKVLDIGSGWGGLARYLAREYDVDVTGLTLSEEQHRKSEEDVQREGLADRVRFKLQD